MMADPQARRSVGDLDFGFSSRRRRRNRRRLFARKRIRQVSEDNNFPSRAPERAKPAVRTVVQQRRRRTGRNVQFNIKATPETIARFTALADSKGVPFGELLDQLLDAAAAPDGKS